MLGGQINYATSPVSKSYNPKSSLSDRSNRLISFYGTDDPAKLEAMAKKALGIDIASNLIKPIDRIGKFSQFVNALLKQQPDTTKLLFHSDQGVQYSAHCFVDYLNLFGITQSMSRRGNCWDNSVMERFFRNLKTERLNQLSFKNHESAVSVVEQYIHFYNYKRLHSTLAYLTPAQKKMELKNAA